MSPTMNLISMTYHLCEKKKYTFMIFWECIIIFCVYIYIITKAVTSGRQETHPEIVVQNGHKVKQSQKV